MPDLNVCTITASLTVPTANQYVIWFDSTRGLIGPAVANSASLVSTAGQFRGRYARQRIDFTVACTTQDVTVVRQGWIGGAWVTVASGSETVTAGTPFPKGWMPETPDYRIYVLAGATPPGALDIVGTLTRQDAASGA